MSTARKLLAEFITLAGLCQTARLSVCYTCSRLREYLVVMPNIQTLDSFDRIKLLADSRRMEILRLLMASPATLTQLARRLRQSPAWVRHHLKALEAASLVALVEVRTSGRITEKYYQACAGGLLLQQLVLPKTRTPVVVFSGSHDLALQQMVARFGSRPLCLTLYVGSVDGLLNLRQGLCQLSGAHLLDEDGEYNAPFVRRLFPQHEVELITLAHRTQGLILARGNPKSIRALRDLARPDIHFINRNKGSGTRVWLDRALEVARIPTASIQGFEHEAKTHTETASAVHGGKADVAVGLQAAAHQYELEFLPLFEERYDLILRRDHEPDLAPFLDYIQTSDFRSTLGSMTGYNTAHSGEQIPL